MSPADGELLHEEHAEIGTEVRVAGSARITRRVEGRRHEQVVPRSFEEADVEHVPAEDGDSGEVLELEDGSLSIPVLEEEVVVTTRMVVRERIIVRKRTVVEDVLVEVDLRSQHVEVEADEGIVVHDHLS